jgi:hypothetical protein
MNEECEQLKSEIYPGTPGIELMSADSRIIEPMKTAESGPLFGVEWKEERSSQNAGLQHATASFQ